MQVKLIISQRKVITQRTDSLKTEVAEIRVLGSLLVAPKNSTKPKCRKEREKKRLSGILRYGVALGILANRIRIHFLRKLAKVGGCESRSATGERDPGSEPASPVGPATHEGKRYVRARVYVSSRSGWEKGLRKPAESASFAPKARVEKAWAESRNGLAHGETYLGPVHSQRALINTCFGCVSYLYLATDRKEVWDRYRVPSVEFLGCPIDTVL